MNFPLPNWCERKEHSPSTQLQPSLQLAFHEAVRPHASNNSSNPQVLRDTPREQKVKFGISCSAKSQERAWTAMQ